MTNIISGRSRKFWTILLGFIAFCLPLAVFYPVVFQGRTFSTARGMPGVEGTDIPVGNTPFVADNYRIDPGASAFQFEPWAEVTSRELHQHSLPLWNPYQAAGTPLAANGQSATFDPLLALVNLHPTPLTWDITFLFAYGLGSLFMFLFLSQIGIRPSASLLGSVIFLLSAIFALSSNNSFIRSYMYLPILLWLVERITTRRTWLPVALFGVAFAGLIFIGMPEATFAVMLVVGPYALYRIFANRSTWRINVMRMGIGGFLGLLIAAPLLGIFAQYEPLSWNVHAGNSGAGAVRESTRVLMFIIAPLLNGDPNTKIVQTSVAGSRAWVGGGAIFLAILGFAFARNFLRGRQIFFACITFFAIWKVYGLWGYSILSHAPVFKLITAPAFFSQLIPFSVAVLAAMGAELLVTPGLPILWRRFWGLMGISALGFLILLYRVRNILQVISGQRALVYVGLPLLASAVIFAAFFIPWRQFRVPLVFMAIAIELWILFPQHNLQHRYDPFLEPKWSQAIKQNANKVPSKDGPVVIDRTFGLDNKLYPDTPGALGFEDIRALDALYLTRYQQYIKNFVDPALYDRFTGTDITIGRKTVAYKNNPMFNLLGVRYVIAGGTDPTTFTTDLYPTVPDNPLVMDTSFNESGDRRRTIFQHGGAPFIDLPEVPAGVKYFTFSFALDPNTYLTRAGDGVHFSVFDPATQQEIWGMDVSSASSQPQWFNGKAIVSPGMKLQLRVDAKQNSENDGAGWASLQFLNANSQPVDTQYQLFLQQGTDAVYKNGQADPRSFLVSSTTSVANERGSIRWIRSKSKHEPIGLYRVNGFDPRSEAVVENSSGKITSCQNPGTANITRYGFSKVKIQVDAQCASFLVLTDSYYPGWKASVNGKSTKVLPTDLLFRGIQVPKGKSTVTFSYSPPGFNFTLVISILVLAGVIGLGGVSTVRTFLFWRRRKVHA